MVSTRSSPLSSASPSPPPTNTAIGAPIIPLSNPADPPRAPSSSSSLSNDDDAGMPPSSLPDASAEVDEDDGEDGDSEAPTEPLPKGAWSDSDLTDPDDDDEQEEEVFQGPPKGIRASSSIGDRNSASAEEEPGGQSTPQASTSANIRHATPSTQRPRTLPTADPERPLPNRQRFGSRSPSLTPPPPPTRQLQDASGADPHSAGSPSSTTSSQGIKRKRDGQQVQSATGASPASGFIDASLPNGQINGNGVGELQAGATESATEGVETTPSEHPIAKMSMEDLPLPENTDDPDAQMAFLDALDAFDAEDLGQTGGSGEDVEPEVELEAAPEEDAPETAGAEDGAMEEEARPEEDEARPDDLGEVHLDDIEGMEGVEALDTRLAAMIEPEQADDTDIMDSLTADAPVIASDIDLEHPAQADAEVLDQPQDLGPTPSPAPTPALASSSTIPIVHTHSSHAPPPSQAAMRALLTLELKFATLRDRLYIERMEEAAEEEEMILNGTHPALQILYKTLSHRRERLHELASRRHAQAMDQLKVIRQGEQDAVWSWWTDERDRMHWGEFEQTWSKRRRLAREKNEIESVRWARPVPVVGDPRFSKGFDWSVGPSPARLSADEGNHDLALMEHRQMQLSRHASPATFPPLPNFPMAHQQHPANPPQHPQQAQQHQSSQYASYAGPTYAEAAGTTSGAGTGYGESPRVPSGGAPRSRLGTPAGGGPSAIGRSAQSSQSQTYGGPGLMDHMAYPRNTTALGPSSSGSSISFFQPLSQTLSQQQRREGRTVPTASTMFGPNSSHSNTNSPISQTFPFNQTPSSQNLPSNPNTLSSNPNGTQTTATSLTQNGDSKSIKQENIEHGPWGNRVHVPMGFGLGFGIGGGGSGSSTAGFGTLGSTATPPSLDQPPSYTAVFAAGAGAGSSEGVEKAAKAAMSTSRPPTPNTAPGGSPRVSSVGGNGGFWGKAVGNGNGNGNGNGDEAKGTQDVESTNGNTAIDGKWGVSHGSEQLGSTGTLAQREREDERESWAGDRKRQEESQQAKLDDLKRERERPKYPGLADYLGSGSAAPFGGGLGRMAVRSGTGGPLSPPGVGVSRSGFPSQPPTAIPNSQTASRS